MEKKNLDWANLGFAYRPIDYRWQTRWHDGAWEEGGLTTDPDITLSEAACVFHYSQSCFEGLKAYTTKDGHIVTFRNACRIPAAASKCRRSRRKPS